MATKKVTKKKTKKKKTHEARQETPQDEAPQADAPQEAPVELGDAQGQVPGSVAAQLLKEPSVEKSSGLPELDAAIATAEINVTSVDDMEDNNPPDGRDLRGAAGAEVMGDPVVAIVEQGYEMDSCGLPIEMARDKKALISYLKRHRIEHEHRKKIQVTQHERELYKIYSDSMRSRRLEIPYFVAALRLWKTGKYPLSPVAELDLNALAVGE